MTLLLAVPPRGPAPIEGYFVYHKPYEASDADYKKQTLLGPARSSHLLTELKPNTQYSIKMRCFNAAGHTVVKKTLCKYSKSWGSYITITPGGAVMQHRPHTVTCQRSVMSLHHAHSHTLYPAFVNIHKYTLY